jgi:hypothetical protein
MAEYCQYWHITSRFPLIELPFLDSLFAKFWRPVVGQKAVCEYICGRPIIRRLHSGPVYFFDPNILFGGFFKFVEISGFFYCYFWKFLRVTVVLKIKKNNLLIVFRSNFERLPQLSLACMACLMAHNSSGSSWSQISTSLDILRSMADSHLVISFSTAWCLQCTATCNVAATVQATDHLV